VGLSNYTNIATVVLNVPAAPTNLTATVDKGVVTLKWADKSNNETGFQVERSNNGSVFAVIGTTPTNATNYKDTTTVVGQRYYYRVVAKNNVGLSSYSNVVTIPWSSDY
jgi:fibronectin type 3 domain-containing protein